MYTHIKSIILLNGDLYNTLYHMNPKQIIVSLFFQRTNKLTSMQSYVNFQADVLDKVVIHLVLVLSKFCIQYFGSLYPHVSNSQNTVSKM